MHFRTKITVAYSVLVLLLAFVIGIAYGNYNMSRLEKNEYGNLQIMTEKITKQLEETIKPMKFISEYLLSDVEVLDALVTLSTVDSENKLAPSYIKEAEETIRLRLNSYYILKNFYRVLVYNTYGNVVASENYGLKKIDDLVSTKDILWLTEVQNKKGSPVLIGIHEDEWGIGEKEKLFSVVREVQGMSMGYIEVQKNAWELEEIFSTGKDEVDVVAVQTNGGILYSSIKLDKKSREYYSALANDSLGEVKEYKNPINDETEIISSLYSEDTKVTVLLVENKEVIRQTLSFTTPMTVSVALLVLMASFLYIFILSGILTKPMRQLRGQMERTGLETLENKIIYDKSNDEIAALSKAYQRVLKRLNDAIVKERERSMLQLQAQYDTLQAQVNPHFLYNVLNVISYRGVKNNDEVICNMCHDLASMLRYSTNNRERESKIADEIEHVDKYFYLLKQRYKHKMEYEIIIDKKIENQRIPKIVLQQIAENSITHGFDNIDEVMDIRINGWEEGGWWYISVCDNGQGFSVEVKNDLEKKMKEVKELLLNGERNIELEIGGMGLINTYARLLLLYEDNLVFVLSSNEKGTTVTIGALMKEKGEILDVSSNCSR